jgi:hypothetical protein
MLTFLKKFFGKRPTVSPCPEAPYKIENPVAIPETTVAAVPMTTQYVQAPAEETKPAAKKKPAARKPAGEKKPAVRAKTARTKKAS